MTMVLSSSILLLLSGIWLQAVQHIASQESLQYCDISAAVCVVNNGTVSGTIRLFRQPYSYWVSLYGDIKGLTPGLHGFHVHQYGDLSNGCANAGPHFNPFQKKHGAPYDFERHVGDLGNIEAGWDGIARVNTADYQLQLCGFNSIMGRAIVIHALQDDLGRGGNEESLKTGNSGPRVGCCVIGATSPQ